jgi:uncharacterized membrane protein HdeD (DUF308 family)
MAQQTIVHTLHTWHQSPYGLLLFAFIELLVAYIFGSLAIDTASFLYYGLTLLFIAGGLRNVALLIRYMMSGGLKK